MTPAEIVKTVRDAINSPVTANHGVVSVAGNPFEVIELLEQNPGGFRVILLWERDEDASAQQPCVGIVNTTIAVVVSQNRGLRAWKGDNLYNAYGSLPALTDLVDLVRTAIRATIMPEGQTSSWWLYLGCEPETTPQGLPLDAYRLRFRITNAIVPASS